MDLQQEIDARAKEIHTDSYPMSIGELVNLYRDGELDLQPEFQRFFRWTPLQKSKLIESILLGIPIPSIFVAQRKSDGVWDVVDGLQRLSTIFQFIGVLKDRDGKNVDPIALIGTDYLPSLEGKVWDPDAAAKMPGEPLTQSQRLAVKRTKLSLNIVKRESASETTLELFHRLNTLGTRLSDQEQRNCLLLLTNRRAFEWATDLAKNPAFLHTINISEAMLEQRFDVELVWRFACIRNTTAEEQRKIVDIAEFLTRESLKIARDPSFDYDAAGRCFSDTFEVLDQALGENAFRKYDPSSAAFTRSFLLSSFEAAAPGVAANLDAIKKLDPKERARFVCERTQQMWSEPKFLENMGSGKTPARRISNVTPFGIKHFRP